MVVVLLLFIYERVPVPSVISHMLTLQLFPAPSVCLHTKPILAFLDAVGGIKKQPISPGVSYVITFSWRKVIVVPDIEPTCATKESTLL